MHIGLLLFPGCMPAGLLAFADLLHAANRRCGQMLFHTHWVARTAGPVPCGRGLTLQAELALDDDRLQGLLLPGAWAESESQVEELLQAEADLIASLARQPQRVQLWAYCVGVCLLAASGQLQASRASVTWWLAAAMRRRFPRVLWCSDPVSPGEGRVGTASGVNGWLPLAQALIEQHAGASVFRDINALMVLPQPARVHEAFQSMSLIEQGEPLLRRIHGLVERWPATRITVTRLAAALNTSPRTLARQLQAAAGVSVAAYVRRVKLHQASERLIQTQATVAAISDELGFSSESNLARMFRQQTGLTPVQYRQQYGRG